MPTNNKSISVANMPLEGFVQSVRSLEADFPPPDKIELQFTIKVNDIEDMDYPNLYREIRELCEEHGAVVTPKIVGKFSEMTILNMPAREPAQPEPS